MQTLLCLLLVVAADPAPATMPLDAAPGSVPALGRKVRLYLQDGQQLTGELVSESKDTVAVRIAGGAPVQIDRSSIKELEDGDAKPSPDHWFRDPGVTRSFYAPTGFMLRQGEGYFSQKELLFSSFGYGVTDNFSVLVGTLVPFWFSNGTANLVGGFKVGGDINELWHVAVGAQAFALPFMGSTPTGLGMVFGTATIGNPMQNVTIALGGAGATVGGFFPPATLIAEVGGAWRVAPNVALETENWFFPNMRSISSTEPFMMLNSGGVRLMNEHLAADLGMIRIPGVSFPIPWVDFTYTFGT